MHRLMGIATFVILAGIVSASAQRGGMRGAGGGRGVSISHASGGHSFSGMRGASSARGSFARPSFRSGGFGGGRFRSRGFDRSRGCRRGFGYPWYPVYGYAGYYAPYDWWDWSSSYDYDEDQARDLAYANDMDALSLEAQRLRERDSRDRERDQDLYARRSYAREEERVAAGPATALVFRDQHVEEVRNYAIAGETLWVLNDHQTGKKIPLSQIDLAATARMNDDRGVDFQVPK